MFLHVKRQVKKRRTFYSHSFLFLLTVTSGKKRKRNEKRERTQVGLHLFSFSSMYPKEKQTEGEEKEVRSGRKEYFWTVIPSAYLPGCCELGNKKKKKNGNNINWTFFPSSPCTQKRNETGKIKIAIRRSVKANNMYAQPQNYLSLNVDKVGSSKKVKKSIDL